MLANWIGPTSAGSSGGAESFPAKDRAERKDTQDQPGRADRKGLREFRPLGQPERLPGGQTRLPSPVWQPLER